MELQTRSAVSPSDRPDRATRRVGETEHLRVTMADEVVIVEPVDALDRLSIDALDRLLSEVDAPAVIDLRHCAPADADGLAWLDPRRWGRLRGSVCVVTDRDDDGAQRAATQRRLAVFGQPADAIQALLLADTGYGTGWT